MRGSLPAPVATGVYQLGLGGVNVFFVEDDDGGLALIDAGSSRGGRIGAGLGRSARARRIRGIVSASAWRPYRRARRVKEHTGAEGLMQARTPLPCAMRAGRALEPGPGLIRSADRGRH